MTAIAPLGARPAPASPPSAVGTAAGERFAAALTAARAPLTASGASRRFVTLGEMATGALRRPGGFGSGGAGALGLGALAGRAAAALPAGAVPAPLGGGAGGPVIEAATAYLGVPYRWGGTDPATGLDCSGFVQRVYADLGVSLPRVSVDQARAGTAVPSLDQAQPGDLIFWRGSPNHIGIYAGEGRMIVAPRTGDVVKFQDITRPPHEIRRII